MNGIIRRATTGAMAVAVALGLALGAVAFTPDGADAKPIAPGGDSFQQGCRSLQSDAQALVDEYGEESTTDARRVEIQGELRSIGRDWKSIGCQAVFGDIFRETPDYRRPGYAFEQVNFSTTVGAYK